MMMRGGGGGGGGGYSNMEVQVLECEGSTPHSFYLAKHI